MEETNNADVGERGSETSKTSSINSPIDNPPLLCLLCLQCLFGSSCLSCLSSGHGLGFGPCSDIWGLRLHGTSTSTLLLGWDTRIAPLLLKGCLTTQVLVVLDTEMEVKGSKEDNEDLWGRGCCVEKSVLYSKRLSRPHFALVHFSGGDSLSPHHEMRDL